MKRFLFVKIFTITFCILLAGSCVAADSNGQRIKGTTSPKKMEKLEEPIVNAVNEAMAIANTSMNAVRTSQEEKIISIVNATVDSINVVCGIDKKDIPAKGKN